jgi:hypothetical protein
MVKLRGCSSSLENFRASSSCGSTRRTWFVYSIAIDTTEVLRELAENAAPTIPITEVCWKDWKNYFVGAFIIVQLTVTAVTLFFACRHWRNK